MQKISGKVLVSFVTFLVVVSITLFNFTTIQPNDPQLFNNEKFINRISILDSDETVEHLQSLNLTPNHSVQILSTNRNGLTKSKILHGRFLHITDMHPDELNIIGSAIRKKCHKKLKNLSDLDISHKYGDPMSGCDSPVDLYAETLEWVKENIKDHIDFVIWTGDNIRHDNDRNYPRTELDIFEMNEKVANDMTDAFMDDDEKDVIPFDRRVKLVPSLGNNDVYPHNLFAPGPTLQTRELYKIWRDFIPTEQMHTFDRGAYFLREVIPGKLVVLSINTLYWFQSNPLCDNCDSRKQPGYKLFLWLGATLKECRRRGLKVWLSGHVPPIPKNIHHSCYSKISVWMHEYRDLIIGGVWGHMNIDHFVALDSVKAWRSIQKRLLDAGALTGEENELPFINYDNINDDFFEDLELNDDSDDSDIIDHETVEALYSSFGYDIDDETSNPLHTFSDRYMGAPNGKVSYLEKVRNEMYTKLKGKKKGGLHSERYSLAHISASVVPTYNPGLRVWEYNVTELANLEGNIDMKSNNFKDKVYNFFMNSNKQGSLQEGDWTHFFEELERQLDDETEIEKLVTEMEADESKFDKEQYISLMAPSKDKTIPALMPKDLPLGPAYTPQLFSSERYVQYYIDLNDVNYEKKNVDSWEFAYKVHYSTDDEQYNMESLLVKDWIKIGRKFAKSAPADDETAEQNEKLWKNYIDRAFLSSGYQELPDSVK